MGLTRAIWGIHWGRLSMRSTGELNLRRHAGSWVFLSLMIAAVVLLPGQARARYASIVIDTATGQVLHETNADTRNYPASLTKMMTIYLAFEALEKNKLRMGQRLRVSRRAARMPASKLGLKRNRTILVEDAILALIVKSANDAAVVVAEALAGSESKFARLMNKKARALGMTRTSFRNASGLPNRRQLSTARDMARLAQALIADFPQFYRYFSERSFTFKGRTYKSYNRLLANYDGTDGLKTGYTRASGYNLAASAVRNGQRLIAVVFGGRSASARDRHVAWLFDRGFADPIIVRGTPAPAPPEKPEQLLAAEDGTSAAPAPELKSARLVSLEDGPAPSSEHQKTVAEVGTPISLLPPQLESAEAGSGAGAKRPIKRDQVAGAVRRYAEHSAWGVQVGAFHDVKPAKLQAAAVARRFPNILSDTEIVVPYIDGRNGRIYRARLMGLSKTQARGACRRLKSARVDCLVVQSDTSVRVAFNRPVGD